MTPQPAAAPDASMSEEGPTFAPPPLENDVLRERLLTRDGGGGGGTRGSLAKCASKYATFLRHVLSLQQQQRNDDDDDDETTSQNLKMGIEREIQLYQIEATKLLLMSQASTLELEELEAESQRYEDQLQQVQSDIGSLRAQSLVEKTTRRNREEYEALAKLANKRPPRRLLQSQLTKVNTDIADIDQADANATQELQIRETQFQLLFQCMQDLKSSLTNTALEEEQAEKKKAEMAIEGGDTNKEKDDDEEEGLVKMDTSS